MPGRTLLLQSYPADIQTILSALNSLDIETFNSREELESTCIRLLERYNYPLISKEDKLIICPDGKLSDLSYATVNNKIAKIDPSTFSFTIEGDLEEDQCIDQSISQIIEKSFTGCVVQKFNQIQPTYIISGITRKDFQYTASLSVRSEIRENSLYSVFELKSLNVENCDIHSSLVSCYESNLDSEASTPNVLSSQLEHFRGRIRQFFNQISDDDLKKLRRSLPITRSKIDWSRFQPALKV